MSSSEEEEFDIYYNTHEDPNLEMETNYENIQGKNLEKSMQCHKFHDQLNLV